jgi:hypothetical protein
MERRIAQRAQTLSEADEVGFVFFIYIFLFCFFLSNET